jgi:hypothetical protein
MIHSSLGLAVEAATRNPPPPPFGGGAMLEAIRTSGSYVCY